MHRLPLVLLAAAGLALAAQATACVPSATSPTISPISAPSTWRTCTPEEQGIDSALLADGLQVLTDRGTPFHTLLVIRHGCVLLDASRYPYSSTRLHNLASVTKSVMTTLIGIAAGQGKLDLDAPMLAYFPDRAVADKDARKQAITVRHLTGMVNGFESGCMGGDEATLDAMRSQPDWIQAALDRPMARDPGTRFCYDSPGMHLLSAILQQATEMTALEFAREYLFTPLDIRQVAWQVDPQGYNHGWGDLSLTPSDVAKLGYLWLNSGLWDGDQIVPSDWIREAAAAKVQTSPDDYGYGLWVSADSFYAMGRGGQTIKVMPALDAIVVTTGAGLEYDDVANMLGAAFVDPAAALTANPGAVAELDTIVAALGAGPAPEPVAPLPRLAKEVSGTVYELGPNEIGLESVRLDFDDSAVAVLHLLRTGLPEEERPIGLDGLYRFHAGGTASLGRWVDERTFRLEVVEFTETRQGPFDYALRFEGQRLHVTCAGLGLEIEGLQRSP